MPYFGFDASPEAAELMQNAETSELMQHPFVTKEDRNVWFRPNGRALCWKCACKHLGAAAAYASELYGYPQNFVRMIGELYHAHQEVPDKGLSLLFREAYTKALDKGVAPDFDTLIASFYPKYQKYLEDWVWESGPTDDAHAACRSAET